MNATDKEKLAQAKALQVDIENALTKFAWSNGLGCPCGTQFDDKSFDIQKHVQRAYDRYFGHKSPLFPRVKDGTKGGSKKSEPIERSWERTGRGNKFDLLLSLSSKGLSNGKHLLVDVKAKNPSGVAKSFKCTLLGTSSISSQRDLRDVVAKKGYNIIFAWFGEDDEMYIQGFQPLVYTRVHTGALAFQRGSLNVWVDPTQVRQENGFTAVYKLTKKNLVRVTKEVYLMSK